jgi:hypothetical protein
MDRNNDITSVITTYKICSVKGNLIKLKLPVSYVVFLTCILLLTFIIVFQLGKLSELSSQVIILPHQNIDEYKKTLIQLDNLLYNK